VNVRPDAKRQDQGRQDQARQVPLIVTFLYIQPSASESLPLIFVIACGLPQLVLLLSVTYRQLKGKQIAQYTAGKFSTLLKQICKQNQAGDELSDADSLPHQLINPIN